MAMPQALTRRIDALTARAVDDGEAPGVVVGVGAGDAVHLAVAGVGTLGGPALAPDALFRITSMTKPMTAVVVLSLVRARVWPGFDLLDAEGWGLGLAVHADGRYGWDGGFGTSWSNLPDDDRSVVVLTQQLWGEAGPPPIRLDAVAAARG